MQFWNIFFGLFLFNLHQYPWLKQYNFIIQYISSKWIKELKSTCFSIRNLSLTADPSSQCVDREKDGKLQKRKQRHSSSFYCICCSQDCSFFFLHLSGVFCTSWSIRTDIQENTNEWSVCVLSWCSNWWHLFDRWQKDFAFVPKHWLLFDRATEESKHGSGNSE